MEWGMEMKMLSALSLGVTKRNQVRRRVEKSGVRMQSNSRYVEREGGSIWP